MANVLLFHYREAGTAKPLIKALKAADHKVVDAVPEYPDFEPSVEVCQPEVVVVDCAHKFQKGLEAAGYVTNLRAYQGVPVLLVNMGSTAQSFARMKVPSGRPVEAEHLVDEVAKATAA